MEATPFAGEELLGQIHPRTAVTLIFTAVLFLLPSCATRQEPALETAADDGRVVLPFRLDQVSLGESLFQRKRDRMLRYAANYGGEADVLAGPDRLLSTFRANAGLDTRGAEPVGEWESETGYLRGHYAGHFLSLLAQAWASTGDEIYKKKLDYMVEGLAECQQALAAAASRPTPRVEGVRGGAVRLSGSPLGNAEHIRLPTTDFGISQDFTIAVWVNLALDDASSLPDPRQTPLDLIDSAAIFDFGSPNPDFAEEPLAHLGMGVRLVDGRPIPRFAITSSGAEAEQSLEGTDPLPIGSWVHLAISKSGPVATLYVDGRAAARTDEMTLTPSDLGAIHDYWIGRRQFPQRTVSYLNATLDEFVMFGRGLDQDAIHSLRNPDAAALASTAGEGAAAWYRFDEEAGPKLLDSSGNGRDAEIIAPTDGRRHPGFLSAYPETQFVRLEEFATYGGSRGIWAPYYTLHKIMAGLLDAHRLADNQQALEILIGLGDWVHSRLEPLSQEQLDHMWDLYIAGEYGGINESQAELHARTGDPAYLEAAERFVNRNVYGPTAAGEDILAGRHANQHIPQFTGYLRTYEQGHDEEYLAAARNFWDELVPDRIYAHGGLGVGEMLRGSASAASLFEESNHAETCPLYNLLKLSRDLFFHDPDPKYMNYYELGLFNQMLASRRDTDSDTSPEVTYFVPVQPGSRREYGNAGTCCGGTGLESHTKYQDSIYFRSRDDSTLYVNLYIASTLRWPERGLTLVQETRYPEDGVSRLTFGGIDQGSGPLELQLRVPTWVDGTLDAGTPNEGPAVSVNGTVQDVAIVPGTYVTLSRDWNPGDVVEITMPLRFHVERTDDDPTVQSLYYGPTLLALQADAVSEDLSSGLLELSLYPDLKLDGILASAVTSFTGGDSQSEFLVDGFTFLPFYVADPVEGPIAVGDGEEPPPMNPYHLYFRRHEPRIAFGSVDSGVANPVGADGATFLDDLWSEAPFDTQADFRSAAERIAAEWQRSGLLTQPQSDAILAAADQAEDDLRIPTPSTSR